MGLLDKKRIIAPLDYNRWLIPPAALAIHLCIGMAYGFSVFWLPLSKSIGISNPVACSVELSFFEQIFATHCDWKISMLGWTFTLFFVFLGSSAALFGGWLEHQGPRKVGVIAACCWCGGLIISAFGVYVHAIWLLWLGSGIIGGIGLGLGYISPVSTLIKWFPEKRGLATGMAIMGFGGGAMVGAPLADKLMQHFATPDSVGVWETLLVMAGIYFFFMLFGAFCYRLPHSDWEPNKRKAAEYKSSGLITRYHVHVNTACKTPQFWLLWGVLCLNVSAGIGILGIASPMLQEVFAGQMLGIQKTFSELSMREKAEIATIAAGFIGLLSLLNIIGRIGWAAFSDHIGRKVTYFTFFILGFLLYISIPTFAHMGNIVLFVLAFCLILSMYGGGFATIPAYLADIFGTSMVGAIHGRLLTAWSVAGILGPVIVNYVRDYQLTQGLSQAQLYNFTAYILASLLMFGFVCNLLIKPVHPKYYMSKEFVDKTQKHSEKIVNTMLNVTTKKSSVMLLIFCWLLVGIRLLWGFSVTLQKTWLLFKGF